MYVSVDLDSASFHSAVQFHERGMRSGAELPFCRLVYFFKFYFHFFLFPVALDFFLLSVGLSLLNHLAGNTVLCGGNSNAILHEWPPTSLYFFISNRLR